MAKRSSNNENIQNQWTQELCARHHEIEQESHKRLEEKYEELKHEIELTKKVCDEKIGNIDEALRGNVKGDSLGIFEQLRLHKKYFIIGGMMFAMLFGFKIGGVTLHQLSQKWIGVDKIEAVNEIPIPMPIPTTQPKKIGVEK